MEALQCSICHLWNGASSSVILIFQSVCMEFISISGFLFYLSRIVLTRHLGPCHPMPQASQWWHPGLTCWWWWWGGCRLMLMGVGLFWWLVFFMVSDREVLPWDLTGCFQVYQVCVCVFCVCVCVSGHVCFLIKGYPIPFLWMVVILDLLSERKFNLVPFS